MGTIELLKQARGAGLDVQAVGAKLRVSGPRQSEQLALRLLDRKGDLMPILEAAALVAPPRFLAPDDLPGDWRVDWEERAAIREYEGGQTREHAEAEAFNEVLYRMRAVDSISDLT